VKIPQKWRRQLGPISQNWPEYNIFKHGFIIAKKFSNSFGGFLRPQQS
jgi:hypothetical protein